MKVVICSCARCTSAGSEVLLDSVYEVKSDLQKAYAYGKIDKKPDIEVEFTSIMNDMDQLGNVSPLAKVDDTYYEKIMPEQLMEQLYDEYSPKDEVNKWKKLT